MVSFRFGSVTPSFFTGLAGIPTAVTLSSSGFKRTALAAMEQLSPTSKAPNILAPAPTITLFPRVG